MKLLAGTKVRRLDKDLFVSGGAGAKFYPTPWLAFSTYLPVKWSVGEDARTARDVDLVGVGDLSLGATFDLPELLHPTMKRVACPETGGPILSLADDDDFIKSGHLTFSFGLSVPTGRSDHAVKWWYYPAQYQPGGGVWGGSAGAFYAQGIGPVTPGAGVTYVFGGGKNPAGYDKPDSLVYSASLNWMFWPGRLGRTFGAVNVMSPVGRGRIDGKDLAGSDMTMVLADVGVALWAGSFWGGARKITAGLTGTVPLFEGSTPMEPRNGYAFGAFCTFGL